MLVYIFWENGSLHTPHPLPQITLFSNGEGIVLLLGSSVSVNVKRNLATCRNRSVIQIMFVISKSRQSQWFCQKMLVVLHIMTFRHPRPLHRCTYNILVCLMKISNHYHVNKLDHSPQYYGFWKVPMAASQMLCKWVSVQPKWLVTLWSQTHLQ